MIKQPTIPLSIRTLPFAIIGTAILLGGCAGTTTTTTQTKKDRTQSSMYAR